MPNSTLLLSKEVKSSLMGPFAEGRLPFTSWDEACREELVVLRKMISHRKVKCQVWEQGSEGVLPGKVLKTDTSLMF